MKITDYHATYFANELTKRQPSNSLEKMSATLSDAQVDLNPHQIEAALFAFRSPLSKGAILADEVGLGKTIEAGLVLSQKWAERKRRILLIVPSSLRKQWNAELAEKFFLPSTILESKSFNDYLKNTTDDKMNPFFQEEEKIVICSYHFARAKANYLKKVPWDLAVIDEAHRLRNVYKTSNKIAREIKEALSETPKILLTATPLQNSLLELYGLVSIIDDHVFGDLKSFKDQYARVSRELDIYESELGMVEPRQERFADLKERLKSVCTRTLRRQVLEYIKYTERKSHTEDYYPTEQEQDLYRGVSEYLQRPRLYGLPNSQRQLISLVLRKLLASSSYAIASTLQSLVYRLEMLLDEAEKQKALHEVGLPELSENFEALDEMADEWVDDEEVDGDDVEEKEKVRYTDEDILAIKKEKADLEGFRDLAKSIYKNSKGEALLTALKSGFKMAEDLNASRKAVIFTESTITQGYLKKHLSENGYEGKIVLFNGSNNDDASKETYRQWKEKYADTDKITSSKTADMRAALIEEFQGDAEILIATEAGAEGINLQFCSIVINYDLPWNPQRIEQRIGRCHRYGQKHDVVVINFLNRKNAADQRVYELLDQKFQLFKGVFGASDEVLGSIQSGVDFEKRVEAICQECRSDAEINASFDALQQEMQDAIDNRMRDTRQTLLENFDEEVHQRLRTSKDKSEAFLDARERMLWDVTKYYLKDDAEFADIGFSFSLKRNPFSQLSIDLGPYRIGKNIEDAHVYRPSHPLASQILNELKDKDSATAEVVFDCSGHDGVISVLRNRIGTSGVLAVSRLTVKSLEEEDDVSVIALTDTGELIDEEDAKKLFQLNGIVAPASITPGDMERLENMEKNRLSSLVVGITERNAEFFDEEVEKLDKWAEDVKRSLELDIKKLDIDIKTAQTNARKMGVLQEKLKAQRQIKEMEKKRTEMRRKLYDEQDKVESRKEALIAQVEGRLMQDTVCQRLFTVRFKIV